MNKVKKEWFPSEEYLKSIRAEVDYILSDYKNILSYKFHEGCGRIVVLIDKIAIKIPTVNDDAEDYLVDGVYQNSKEYKVYTETNHSLLNPVYEDYNGCLLCKAVENDFSKLKKEYGFTGDEISQQIENKVKELDPLIKKYNLSVYELLSQRNWGYDFLEDKFVCLDYGI